MATIGGFTTGKAHMQSGYTAGAISALSKQAMKKQLTEKYLAKKKAKKEQN